MRKEPLPLPLVGLLLLSGAARARADARPTLCTYGLFPTGIKARWVPREAREARARSIAAARRLWDRVAADTPMSAASADLAELFLLVAPTVSSGGKIAARNGGLVPLAGEGLLRREQDALVGTFPGPGGAELALDLRAISFRARVRGFTLRFWKGRPRLGLELLQPVDVARMWMRPERACQLIELKLDEP